jgi:hypothetical protein
VKNWFKNYPVFNPKAIIICLPVKGYTWVVANKPYLFEISSAIIRNLRSSKVIIHFVNLE